MTKNVPATQSDSALALNYDDPKLVATLKATVAQGLTDAEFVLFAQHCRSTGLNPFKKEVWAIKAGGRLQVMTGINGYWAIANAHPQFDGYEEDVETDARGTILKAWCKVYRKDRRFPSMAVALLAEYKGQSPIWSKMPSVMLLKCAESVALRKAFPQELNGTYTDAEMPSEYETPQAPPQAPQRAPVRQAEVVSATVAIKTAEEVAARSAGSSGYRWATGKHKGLTLDETPPDYIEWVAKQKWCPSEVATYRLATPPKVISAEELPSYDDADLGDDARWEGYEGLTQE